MRIGEVMIHSLAYRYDPFRCVYSWHVDGKALEFRAFPTPLLVMTANSEDILTGWVKTIMVGVEFESGWRPGYADIWPILYPGLPLPRGATQTWPQTP